MLALAFCVFFIALGAQNSSAFAEKAQQPATLGIVFSDAEYALSLIVPAADIVGFEHPPADADEQAQVAVAISDLSQPLALFVVNPEAGCMAVSANVTLVGSEANLNGRAEFQAEYAISCPEIGALGEMRFDYFDRFISAERLRVQIMSATGSHTVEVTRETPLADLSGLL